MAKVRPETRLKRFVRGNYPGWSEAYEPGLGSGVGYPDIQVLGPSGKLLPIELKIGVVKAGRLHPSEVRGPQVVWHREFAQSGGISVMLIGLETGNASGKFDLFFVPGMDMIDWKEGYEFDKLHHIMADDPLLSERFVGLVQYFLKESPVSPLRAVAVA